MIHFTIIAVTSSLAILGWWFAYVFFRESEKLSEENDQLKEQVGDFPKRDEKTGRFVKRK